MHSEPFHPDAPPDVATDAAVIHPVTPAALDDVAHRAAQMADDVAHHAGHGAATDPAATGPAETVVSDEVPSGPAAPLQDELAGSTGAPASEAVADVQRAAADVLDTTDQAVERSGAVLARTADVAGDAAATAVDAAAHMASDAENRLSGAGDAIGRYNAAVFGMIRTNMAATGELFAALVGAQSVPEAVAINADHLRRQFDTLTTQGRELAHLAQTLAFDTLKPLAAAARRDG